MARHRSRFKLRMELAAEKPWMTSELDDFNQVAVRRQAAQEHTLGGKFRTISVVEFIAVAVALSDLFSPVQLCCQSLILQHARIASQAHGSAFAVDRFLFLH